MNSAQLEITPRPRLSAVIALLAREHLPTTDLTEQHCEHFFLFGPPAAPTGLVGLELSGAVGLLRSLAVQQGNRGAGHGTALVRYAEDHARAYGVRDLFLLTTTAEAFFARLGYRSI